MRHTRSPTAALAAATLMTLLLATVWAPLSRAGSLPEDVIEAARDGDSDYDCPDWPLDRLVICIVEDTINNNSVVRSLVRHVGYHYQNVSDYRNQTVRMAINVTWATLDYEWAVEYATYVYVDATEDNVARARADAEAIAADLSAYAARVREGECVFLFDQPCPTPSSTFDVGRIGDGPAPGPISTCGGLVNIIRCHYTTVAYEAVNQTLNTTFDGYWLVLDATNRQLGATWTYAGTVLAETIAYERYVLGQVGQHLENTRGFAERECKLLLSNCPIGTVWVDIGGLVGGPREE